MKLVDLIDLVLEGFKDVVEWIISQFLAGMTSGYRVLSESMFRTPVPKTNGPFVFGEPLGAPWVAIRDAVIGGDVMLLALLLLVISVQGRHTVRIFNVGAAYEAQKARKTAWVGAIIIITWYWIGVLTLYLVNGFTVALFPSLAALRQAMIGFLQLSLTNLALSFILVVLGGISMWALQALFYLREILLYVYMYGMPLAIAVAYGNVPVLSDIAMRLAKKFVPLAVLPLPAAVLFKGYDLLYGGGGTFTPPTPFLQYLVATSLPVIAVLLTWKTFKYASPVTARVIGGVTRGAVTAGAVATGAYLAGPTVAATAARWGPKAALSHAAAHRLGDQRQSSGGQTADNVADDRQPEYRRTENDPMFQ